MLGTDPRYWSDNLKIGLKKKLYCDSLVTEASANHRESSGTEIVLKRCVPSRQGAMALCSQCYYHCINTCQGGKYDHGGGSSLQQKSSLVE